MKTTININDFTFQKVGSGSYRVCYTSPKTNKKWYARTNNMPLIDSTKNKETPKKIDLNKLKRLCKL